MNVVTSTADQWESDLAELLGLDVARPHPGGVRTPYRANMVIVGALAIAALLSVGMAVQRRSAASDRSASQADVRVDATGTTAPKPSKAFYAALPPSAAMRPNGSSNMLEAERPAPSGSTHARAPESDKRMRALPARAERTAVSDRLAEVMSHVRLAATDSAAPEVATGSVGKGPPAESFNNHAVDTARRRAEEDAVSGGVLVVPLHLLLPDAPRTTGRSPAAGNARTPPDKESGTRSEGSKAEAIDALRSLRRQ